MIGPQHRMDDLLELLDRRRVMHHFGREPVAIDLAVDGRARKCSFDGGRSFPPIDFVNGGIRVVNRDAGFRKELCGGRLPHPD